MEFDHLLESFGRPLPLWYFEFPQFSFGIRLKPQISQVSSFCIETGILALGALGCVNNHRKTKKVSYNVGIEGFLR
jgi:hypothetical protein